MKREEKRRQKTIIEKIVDIDERYVYFLIFILMSIPILRPIGLPLKVTEQPKKTFEAIEALEPNSIVVFGYDAHSGEYMDQGPPAEAVLLHLMKKPGVRIVGMTISAQGGMFWEDAINKVDKQGKKYGEDYVWLGFVPGEETGLGAAADDIWKFFSEKDAYGTSFTELPLMQDFHTATDPDLLVVLTWGEKGFLAWLRQWQEPYNLRFIQVPLGAQVGLFISFLASGQIYSWVAGTRQAGEYQLLLHEPGPIIGTMDAQSMGHIFTILLLIVGNLLFILRKQERERLEIG